MSCQGAFLVFAKLSVGVHLVLLTWSLSHGPLYQKEQAVVYCSSPRSESFNLGTIKRGITIQRAALQSVRSDLFSHASLSPTVSVPSYFCLVVNTSITACPSTPPPLEGSHFLDPKQRAEQFHIPAHGSSIRLNNNGTFCVLIKNSFHETQWTLWDL